MFPFYTKLDLICRFPPFKKEKGKEKSLMYPLKKRPKGKTYNSTPLLLHREYDTISHVFGTVSL
jgi:hypothetical protein